jgi:hypothetical protein
MTSFMVERQPDQDKNVIVVTIEGVLTVDMVRSIYKQIAEIAETMEGPIYRITDVRKEESTFMDIVRIIKEAGTGAPGTTTDPRIQNVFVGRGKMAAIAKDVLENTKQNLSMPMFGTMEDAFTYIEQQELIRSQGT